MALICPACGSDNAQEHVNAIQCLECLTRTSFRELNETPQPTHRKG